MTLASFLQIHLFSFIFVFVERSITSLNVDILESRMRNHGQMGQIL